MKTTNENARLESEKALLLEQMQRNESLVNLCNMLDDEYVTHGASGEKFATLLQAFCLIAVNYKLTALERGAKVIKDNCISFVNTYSDKTRTLKNENISNMLCDIINVVKRENETANTNEQKDIMKRLHTICNDASDLLQVATLKALELCNDEIAFMPFNAIWTMTDKKGKKHYTNMFRECEKAISDYIIAEKKLQATCKPLYLTSENEIRKGYKLSLTESGIDRKMLVVDTETQGLAEKVLKAVKLSAQEKSIMVNVMLNSMTYKAYADKFGLDESTVGVRIRSIQKKCAECEFIKNLFTNTQTRLDSGKNNDEKKREFIAEKTDESGKIIHLEFSSLGECENVLNISRANIQKVLKGKRNSAGGYVFKYKL